MADGNFDPQGCAQCNFAGEQMKLLKQIAGNVQVMSVKLFGASEADDENGTGRLAMLEQGMKEAHDRIDKLEGRWLWAAGFAAAVGVIVQLVASHFWK